MRELGRGGEGVVALYKRVADGKEFAVKFEFKAGANNTLLQESLFMKDVKDMSRIPKYELHGTI